MLPVGHTRSHAQPALCDHSLFYTFRYIFRSQQDVDVTYVAGEKTDVFLPALFYFLDPNVKRRSPGSPENPDSFRAQNLQPHAGLQFSAEQAGRRATASHAS